MRRWFVLVVIVVSSAAPAAELGMDALAGRPADIASSAYEYRADRAPAENPPEGWILVIQRANLPYDRPIDVRAPAVKKILCGLLWEEVRPVRQVELAWPSGAARRPAPADIELAYFDGTDESAHTWWNPRAIKDAGPPRVEADGLTYVFALPGDTWGIVASVRGAADAAAFDVPAMRVYGPDVWKKLDIEIEWGFQAGTEELSYDGRIDAYDGIIGAVRPLPCDAGTRMAGAREWRSAAQGGERRGIALSLLSIGASCWRRVWPYDAQSEDVARTIVTVATASGAFSFLAADLEAGPILAPEYGFFVRRTSAPAPAEAPPAPARAAPPMHLLREAMDSIPGVPRVRGWATNVIPWFGVNASNEPGRAGSLTVPARSAAMHPLPSRDVAACWRSPLGGRVRVAGRVAMGDAAGGNGILWSVARDRGAERETPARGELGTGGASDVPPAGGALDVEVAPGDVLSLIVGAKNGDHFCDTTIVAFTIAEEGGCARVWDLARDVLDGIHEGNPRADAFGNADVWSFAAADAVRVAPPPAPSEPPFDRRSAAATARAFVKELEARGLSTIRQRVRAHPEQTWEGAVAAMHGDGTPPPIPAPEFAPPMEIDVPCARLAAQWKLGAWHLLRRAARGSDGTWRFNDHPFGILASETYMILRALDLQGMHKEAGDGLEQWLRLPLEPRVVPGQGGHHPWARPDRPLGHFSDGRGCLTHAEGPAGAGGHMDGVHCMGPGAIVFALAEHFSLTGDLAWLAKHAPRMKANAQWILRQRQLLAAILPGGERLRSKGLQPAHVVTPDSLCMHMQFYETEAYYWLAVARTAEMLALLDPAEGAALSAEAEAYRGDLVRAVERSIALTPVVAVRDGTYRSFIPFAPYVRGFAAGAWGWRRCQGHVGAIYWDTVQSAGPLISPSGLLSPHDPRVQGHLDVLEDRLLLENTKVNARTSGYDPETHWFSCASWQYQCGLERHANIHLAAGDAPNFIRSMLNQYAVDIMPGEYTFREHTTGGPPDKSYEEACFLERFRQMLVMEEGDTLWLARAAPRAWLAQGKTIAVRNAPTHFGVVDYAIESDADNGRIAAAIAVPARTPPAAVMLRVRHPRAAPIRSVTVDGKPWNDVDRAAEAVRLRGCAGSVRVVVTY
ncbi:MAG TPA: hypothetical protein DCM87_21690 [Planctomycetes bacterium]|nr:hypothetical protein [Planctomycetota bacterium]